MTPTSKFGSGRHGEMPNKTQEAFGNSESKEDLLTIVLSLKDAGAGQDELTSEFTIYSLKLREAGEHEKEDEVLEILDCVVGWCSPHARIFP